MTLQQLEYVMAVYRCKHFAKAADYCNVTQPTLSSMIQKLEEELVVKIFDRSKQPIKPTTEGMLIIERAWSILVRAKQLKEVVEEERHSLSGTFHIAVLPTIAPYLIPRFLPQFMNEYPALDIRITEMKTEDIHRALKHGDIDAGIVAQVEGQEDFDSQQLYFEKFFVYVSKGDALFNNKAIRTSDLKSAAKSKKAYNLGSIETFMRIVESGKGVTFIPELALEQLTEVQEELVRPFAHPIPTRDIILLTQKNFLRTSLRQLVIDKIRASVPAGMLRMNKTQQAL